MLEMRTIYRSTVRSADPNKCVLKSGINSRKLGSQIIKGAWAGLPLFSLKLEERRTCPATCQQLAQCYGNNIGRRAVRWNVDAKLYTRLNVELDELNYHHRAFVSHSRIFSCSMSAAAFRTEPSCTNPSMGSLGSANRVSFSICFNLDCLILS